MKTRYIVIYTVFFLLIGTAITLHTLCCGNRNSLPQRTTEINRLLKYMDRPTCITECGISLEEFYNAAKAVQPTHKVGNPLMVKGQPAKVRGDSWKYRRKDSEALKPAQNTLEEE